MSKNKIKRFKNGTTISYHPPGSNTSRIRGNVVTFIPADAPLSKKLNKKHQSNFASNPVNQSFYDRYAIVTTAGKVYTPLRAIVERTGRVLKG